MPVPQPRRTPFRPYKPKLNKYLLLTAFGLLVTSCTRSPLLKPEIPEERISIQLDDAQVSFAKEQSNFRIESQITEDKIEKILVISKSEVEQRYSEKKCKTLDDLYKRNTDLAVLALEQSDSALEEIARNCMNQSPENFVDELNAWNNSDLNFTRKWTTRNRAGSVAEASLIQIDNRKYYAYSAGTSDCGWHRIYETFLEGKMIQITVLTGSNRSCSIPSERQIRKEAENEIDEYFKKLNITFSISEKSSASSVGEPNEFLLYESPLGVSIKYPQQFYNPEKSKYSQIEIQEYPWGFGIGSKEKVQFPTWKIYINHAESVGEAQHAIQKVFSNCKIGQTKDLGNGTSMLFLKIESKPLDELTPQDCIANFAYNILFNERLKKVIFWKVGQEGFFRKSADDREYYDTEIIESFEFIEN